MVITFAELIPLLRTGNVRLWIEDDKLRYGAPRGAITPALRDALAAHRQSLLDMLAAEPTALGGGARVVDPSAHVRRVVDLAQGVSLEVLDHRGRGPALLFLHGLGGTGHIFDDLAPALTDAFRVLAVTRRGFGASSRPPDGYDVPTLAGDLERLLDALGVERAVLVGHSIAGEELTYFAATRPERVRALIYLDAAYDRRALLDERGETPPAASAVPEAADLTSPVAYGAFLRRTTGVEFPIGELLAAYEYGASGRLLRPAGARDAGRRLAEAVVHPAYARVEAPALAIFAASERPDDVVTGWTRAQADAFRARARAQFLKGVRRGHVVVIDGASHHVFLSHREVVLHETRAFLTDAARE